MAILKFVINIAGNQKTTSLAGALLFFPARLPVSNADLAPFEFNRPVDSVCQSLLQQLTFCSSKHF